MVCGLFGLSVLETFAWHTYRSSFISYDLVFDRNLATYVTRWSMKNGKLAMGCTSEVLNSSVGWCSLFGSNPLFSFPQSLQEKQIVNAYQPKVARLS